jgi:ABC-type branched-subunit amino acid transport system substrate-binding protein
VGDSPVLLDPLDCLVAGPSSESLRVGLAGPASGILGLTGPAAVASAVLAAEEINASGGLRGRRMELVPVDAGADPDEVTRVVDGLVAAGAIEALCGFHTSDVHRRLEVTTTGRIPYLFTPPHEGGTRLPGVLLLGESPVEQMLPVAAQLVGHAGLGRWALIGNDYIWPRAVHAAAERLLGAYGAEVVMAQLVPFGRVDAERLIDELTACHVDAVLLSLVGRDLVTFNRAFACSPLVHRVARVSGALDETGLLEIDGDESGELYATMGWFAADPDRDGFRERYTNRWGDAAPRLGVYASGCYDGLQTLAALHNAHLLGPDTSMGRVEALLPHRRSRLARADGLELLPVG